MKYHSFAVRKHEMVHKGNAAITGMSQSLYAHDRV